MLQIIRAEKVDEKIGSFVKFSCSLPELWFLNSHFCVFLWQSAFLRFYADLNKKSIKVIKAIYVYASERYRYALSENNIVYYAMTYCFGGIRVWIRRTLLNFCWVSITFDILIANISYTVAQTPRNHVIFWKSVMRTFRSIYMYIASTDLGFLLMSAQTCQKCTFWTV